MKLFMDNAFIEILQKKITQLKHLLLHAIALPTIISTWAYRFCDHSAALFDFWKYCIFLRRNITALNSAVDCFCIYFGAKISRDFHIQI